MLHVLGYFALVCQVAVHTLMGEYETALGIMYPLHPFKRKGLLTGRITMANITFFYYAAFCYLSLGRYIDAAKLYNYILAYVARYDCGCVDVCVVVCVHVCVVVCVHVQHTWLSPRASPPHQKSLMRCGLLAHLLSPFLSHPSPLLLNCGRVPLPLISSSHPLSFLPSHPLSFPSQV